MVYIGRSYERYTLLQMIERFSQGFTREQLSQFYNIEKPEAFLPNYNAQPSQLIPVITHESPQGVSFFYWGLTPQWLKNKTVAEKWVNVRSELIAEKPVLQKMLKQRRCIIPADGFYCWKKIGKRTNIPWRFTSSSTTILSFAGVWEEFEDDGETFHTFLILTTPSVHPISDIHDRMPLVLNKNAASHWLHHDTTVDQLLTLLNESSEISWNGYSVSHQLNDLSFNKPSLLNPAPPTDQHGNLTLFS